MPWMIPAAVGGSMLLGDLMQPGGALGPSMPGPSPLDVSKANLINEMIQREGSLWPSIDGMVQGAPQNAQNAYNLTTGPVSGLYGPTQGSLSDATANIRALYPGVMDQLKTANTMGQNFQLSPEALAMLDKSRDSQLEALPAQIQSMLGSSVADLARRGVTSSSTAEGAMSSIGQAIAPTLANINSNYWDQRLALPGQQANMMTNNALQQYGLGSNYSGDLSKSALQSYGLGAEYGNTMGTAATQSYTNPFNMTMQPWQVATTGMTAPSPAPPQMPPSSGISSALGAGLGAYMANSGK